LEQLVIKEVNTLVPSSTALLESPKEYRLRGFTRDVSKDKAKALTSKGVEMVAADISNIDHSVKKAFEGANIAYVSLCLCRMVIH
jgi:hypothetical protein